LTDPKLGTLEPVFAETGVRPVVEKQGKRQEEGFIRQVCSWKPNLLIEGLL
jgi:hypothetical protein